MRGWHHEPAMPRVCPTLREQALFLAEALETRVADSDEVVVWADGVILDTPQPDIAVCEASLMLRSPRAELASTLRSVEGDEPRRAVVRGLAIERLLSRHAAGKLSAERIASWIFHDAVSDEVGWGDFWGEAVRYDDARELARQGVYGTRSVEVADMLSFLSRVVAHWLRVEAESASDSLSMSPATS